LAFGTVPVATLTWTVAADPLGVTGMAHVPRVPPHTSFSSTKIASVCAGTATNTGTMPCRSAFPDGDKIMTLLVGPGFVGGAGVVGGVGVGGVAVVFSTRTGTGMLTTGTPLTTAVATRE
jgi:hypothetical protein